MELEEELFGLRAGLSGRMVWPARAIGESHQAVGLETLEPLIGSRWTDGEAAAELTDVGLRLTGKLNKFEALHWDGILAP